MKTTILILLTAVSIARANLIDLTPGGFTGGTSLPLEFLRFEQIVGEHRAAFFDSATPDGWISLYGVLNGGTYFDTNFPDLTSVSWDFTTLPGWSMRYILVEAPGWGNLYRVGFGSDITDLGDLVTLHGDLSITSLSFYGRNLDSAPVPDTGSTLAMMGFGLLGVFFSARMLRA